MAWGWCKSCLIEGAGGGTNYHTALNEVDQVEAKCVEVKLNNMKVQHRSPEISRS
jgi:hypothetical protein